MVETTEVGKKLIVPYHLQSYDITGGYPRCGYGIFEDLGLVTWKLIIICYVWFPIFLTRQYVLGKTPRVFMRGNLPLPFHPKLRILQLVALVYNNNDIKILAFDDQLTMYIISRMTYNDKSDWVDLRATCTRRLSLSFNSHAKRILIFCVKTMVWNEILNQLQESILVTLKE